MIQNRSDFKQLFYELDLSVAGQVLSIIDKKNIWDALSVPEDDVVFVSETDSLSLTVKLLKAWSTGKKTILSHNVPKTISDQIRDQIMNSEFDYGVWTSGSTGVPKLNIFSLQKGFQNSAMHWASYLERDSIETIIQALPLYHSFGLVCILLTSLQFKKKLVLFKQTPTLNQLSQLGLKNALLNWTPSHLRIESRFKRIDPTFLSVISIGSSQLLDADRTILKERFQDQACYLTYGMTELGPRISTLKFNVQLGALNDLGKPLEGVDWKVVDESHQTIRSGIGHLAVKSATLAKNLESTVDADGFYLTHDIVQVQAGQEFQFIAREYSIVKKSGVRIHLPTIENIVRSFSRVRDCHLSKDEHPVFGEVPILFFVGDLTEVDMWTQLKNELSADFQPHKIYRLDQLPRNTFQKIIYSDLVAIRAKLETRD